MTPLFKAEAPGFIWLIVGIFWVVAQIAGAAAKKQPLRPPVADDETGEQPGDPFAELLRKMAGAEEFRVEPPEFEEEEKPWKPGEIEALPDIQPLQRTAPTPAPIIEELSDVDIRPTMSSFRNTLPSIRMPTLDLNFQTLEKTGGTFPKFGKLLQPGDKKSLRRAILGKIIFSPPKALE